MPGAEVSIEIGGLLCSTRFYCAERRGFLLGDITALVPTCCFYLLSRKALLDWAALSCTRYGDIPDKGFYYTGDCLLGVVVMWHRKRSTTTTAAAAADSVAG